LISAIPIPDPKLEKNKVLFTYDPSVHDYSEDKPELTDIGHGHFVFGNKKEIEEYRAIREKGEFLKSVNFVEEGTEQASSTPDDGDLEISSEILEAPIHDTGSKLYSILSFFLAPLGLIGGFIFKKFKHIRNYKACLKGAIAGFATFGAIILLFAILLILAII
jgi:oligopeptide transport system ATP-binding protein